MAAYLTCGNCGDLVSVGPVTVAVQAAIQSVADDLDEMGRARAAIAVALAQKLDAGAGMATPGVAKELREVLGALVPEADDDADDPIDAAITRMRTAVRNSPN